MDFSGAYAPPTKLKPKSLFEFSAPSFDDSTDIENTHTTGDSPTNAAYVPAGSQPTSNPTVSSAYTPPGGVLGPNIGQNKQPNLVNDIYAPRLRDVTDKLESAYAPPQVGGFRSVLGALLSSKHSAIGGLISGETQRQREIQPLQQEYGLLTNAIGAQRAQRTADLGEQNIQSEIGHRTSQDAIANRLANVKEDPAAKSPTNPLELFLKDPVAAQKYEDMLAANKPDKTPNEKEQAIDDYLKGKNMPSTPANRDRARSVLATRDRPAKDPDLADLGKQIKQAQLEKLKEPTPDEQRRDDLANNLDENLTQLEDIAKRRPELFGPLAGRLTTGKQWLGSSDPDVAALKNIEEQTGLAMVGAHAMRNAQHAEKAAQSITNANKNTADVLLSPLGPIATARKSLQTFRGDANRRRTAIDAAIGGDSTAPAPSGNSKVLVEGKDF